MKAAAASLVALAILLGACLGAGKAQADGASPAVKIGVQPRVLNFRQPRYRTVTTIRGRLLNRKPGTRVVLEASRWPFQQGFRPVGKARTRRGGLVEFERRPSLATRYRVAVPGRGIRSRWHPVYVLPGFTPARCTISGNGRSGGCKNFNASAGTYTLQISYDLLYPKSAYALESVKPFFFYYGQRNGSRRYPQVMALQEPTYPQLPGVPGSTHLEITRPIVLPGTDWRMYWTACSQTSEQLDGLGLPGAPGSHGCGGPTTTVDRFLFGPPLG